MPHEAFAWSPACLCCAAWLDLSVGRSSTRRAGRGARRRIARSLPWTIEVVEINKQPLLLVGAGVAGIAWLGKMLAQRKFEYRKSVVNLIVVLYLAVYVLSALMSKSRYMSLVGDFGQEKAGLITVAAFVLLYFVVINNIRTVRGLRQLFMSIMIGGFVTALYTLLQGLGLFILPFAFAKAASFNGLGTVTATCIYLASIATLAGGLLLSGHNKVAENKKLTLVYNIFLVVTSVIALFVVAMVDYWYVTVCLLVASATPMMSRITTSYV